MTSNDLPDSPATIVPTFVAKAEPSLISPGAEPFYAEALQELNKIGLPFLLVARRAVLRRRPAAAPETLPDDRHVRIALQLAAGQLWVVAAPADLHDVLP